MMTSSSQRCRKRYRSGLQADNGSDGPIARQALGAGNAPKGRPRGFCAIDWSKASLARFRDLRQAIRRGWAKTLSFRRQRNLVNSMFAILDRRETTDGMSLSACEVILDLHVHGQRRKHLTLLWLLRHRTCHLPLHRRVRPRRINWRVFT
jgi:hypothetical protein